MREHSPHNSSGSAGFPLGPGSQPVTRVQPRTTRASTDDRTHVAELLQDHYVAGRLDATELEARVERTVAAVTLADLDAVLEDLPPLPSARAEVRQPAAVHDRRRRYTASGPKPLLAHVTTYLLVMALLVVIWLLTTPGGYFWPVWPMLGWGIGLAAHSLAARDRPPSGDGARSYRDSE